MIARGFQDVLWHRGCTKENRRGATPCAAFPAELPRHRRAYAACLLIENLESAVHPGREPRQPPTRPVTSRVHLQFCSDIIIEMHMRAVGLGRPALATHTREPLLFFSYKALRVATGNGPIAFVFSSSPSAGWIISCPRVIVAPFIKTICPVDRKNMLHNADTASVPIGPSGE